MMLFQVALLVATFLCSLAAGLLFAFAAVVMPGIRSLDDSNFVRSFQVIDRVIQNNQPLFILVWVGSVLGVIAAAVLGVWALAGVDRVLVVIVALVYLLGVQLPTITINVPLNNRLQRLDVITMNETTLQHARKELESRWNRSNVFRTLCASIVSMVLMLLLLRLC